MRTVLVLATLLELFSFLWFFLWLFLEFLLFLFCASFAARLRFCF